MFTRIFIASVLALPVFVAATSDGPSDQCNTGTVQCCGSTNQASNPSRFVADFLGGVGVKLSSVTGLIGVTCSPITGVGAGGNSCTQQPVCCTNNSFNGVVALGCSPINVSL